MAAIASTFADVTTKSGWLARTRSTKSATADEPDTSSGERCVFTGGSPSGGTGYSRSPYRRNGIRLYGEHHQVRASAQQHPDFRRGIHDMLDVVDDEQQPPDTNP